MATKFGFAGLSSVVSNTNDKDALIDQINDLKNKIVCGRVTSIIYDENSDGFEDGGEWPSIGDIEFEIIDYQTVTGKSKGTAKPLFPHIKVFPVLQEVVYLMRMPSYSQGEKTNDLDYYYLPSTNIWNTPNVNPIPNQVKDNQAPDSQKKSTAQISLGATSKSGDSEKDLDFNGKSGGTFEEKSNILPILPFAGDAIFEGRFGNSIRLGNTSKTNSKYKNNWSEEGSNGDPLMILRNGQPDDSPEEGGGLPTTENIDTDKSSLYLTSTQKIPVTAVENYEAFSEPPEAPQEYTSNQAILNSGRLLLNANVDSVLISGQKSIALSANENIGISSNQDVVLSGAAVRIGDKEADHPVILGDDFLDQFANLVKAVDGVAQVLTSAQIFPGGAAAPNLPLINKAIKLKGVTGPMLSILGGDPTLPGSDVKKSKLLSKVTNTA